MALIKCKECGKDFSDKAPACPNCGCPIEYILVNEKEPINNQESHNKSSNTTNKNDITSILEPIGFILAFFCFNPVAAILGLALCLVAIYNNKNKKNTFAKIGIAISIISIIVSIVFTSSENEENEYNENIVESENLKSNEPEYEIIDMLTDKELFCTEIDESSDLINSETANELYDFLCNELLFEKISFEGKSNVGNILYDVSADNYSLMISVDDDGIYSIRCGSYELYDGTNILITKSGLEDRNIGSNKNNYYAIAKEIITNNLKSPKSATFPSSWDEKIKMQRNGNLVAVQGYVDAQNSFGAMLRSEWTVEFEVIDLENYNYKTIYVNIDGTSSGEFIELE